MVSRQTMVLLHLQMLPWEPVKPLLVLVQVRVPARARVLALSGSAL